MRSSILLVVLVCGCTGGDKAESTDSDVPSASDEATETDASDTEEDTEALEQGVDGQLVTFDSYCEWPAAIELYQADPKSSSCDWGSEFDTGFSTGDLWENHVGPLVATPSVDADGAFSAALEVGDFETRLLEDCYGCAAFSVAEGEVTEVEMVIGETLYADAPNVYLYPTQPTAVSVELGTAERIALSTPDYGEGWTVLAQPDGALLAADGWHDFLFYELQAPFSHLQRDAGWCVAGERAQASVEQALWAAGFSEAEIEDFAEFWDAAWPEARWMTVYPQTRGLGALRVTPRPDSLLRLWFLVEPGCHPVEAAVLPQGVRNGFTVTEWGVLFDRAFARDWEPLP